MNQVWVILKGEYDEPSELIGVRLKFEDAKNLIPISIRDTLTKEGKRYVTDNTGFTWYEVQHAFVF